SWIKKGAQLLGLGNRAIREIEVDKSFRIDIRALSEKIAKDRQSGVKPICVVGTIGTVNTGAIDNLEAVADIAKQEGLWFHIDGAFGALVKLSNNLSSLAKGLEKADSLAFDLHKWMYLPFEVACVLVKDKKAHHSTFQQTAKYFNPASRGVIAEGIPFAERGIELTRNFKALKVWMSLKAHGINTFAKLIEQNIYQAKYLASIVESHPELELLAPVSLNIVCFRYKSFNQEQLNQLNQEILLRLQESGIALPSSTIIEGQYCIRVAIVNHRSRVEDFELLVSEIVKLGRKIAKEF
ncbi:MAG: aminotransferase class V-fold PLP-dependent enzyme, partial [Blastocatellia bacterium]|nr:aminotransferase class V-fold PLP-dependent enzyme [Blastocatellia bacterium]